jgi:hypothetical protein
MSRPQRQLMVRLTRTLLAGPQGRRRPTTEVTYMAIPFDGDRLHVEMEIEDRASQKGILRVEFLGETMELVRASSVAEAISLI